MLSGHPILTIHNEYGVGEYGCIGINTRDELNMIMSSIGMRWVITVNVW